MFGTVTGSTVSVENIGLLGSTRVGSRRVIQISAGFMIFIAILGKFGALFASSIPFTIFAALYCVMFGLVASVGLSFLQFTDMYSMRNLFIVRVSLFLGLSIPEYFREYTRQVLLFFMALLIQRLDGSMISSTPYSCRPQPWPCSCLCSSTTHSTTRTAPRRHSKRGVLDRSPSVNYFFICFNHPLFARVITV